MRVAAQAAEVDARSKQNEAEVERKRADEETTKARENLEYSRRLLYASDINLAQQALTLNNLGRARRLVDRHRPKPGEEALRGWEWRYVLPSGHPLAKRPRLTLKDLAAEPFVVLNEAHCLTGNSMSFCARHAMAPVVSARSHQLLTVLELVRLGQGVSLIPAMAVPKAKDAGRVYRSLAGDKPTRTIAVAWNRMRYQTQLLKRFLTFLGAST